MILLRSTMDEQFRFHGPTKGLAHYWEDIARQLHALGNGQWPSRARKSLSIKWRNIVSAYRVCSVVSQLVCVPVSNGPLSYSGCSESRSWHSMKFNKVYDDTFFLFLGPVQKHLKGQQEPGAEASAHKFEDLLVHVTTVRAECDMMVSLLCWFAGEGELFVGIFWVPASHHIPCAYVICARIMIAACCRSDWMVASGWRRGGASSPTTSAGQPVGGLLPPTSTTR